MVGFEARKPLQPALTRQAQIEQNQPDAHIAHQHRVGGVSVTGDVQLDGGLRSTQRQLVKGRLQQADIRFTVFNQQDVQRRGVGKDGHHALSRRQKETMGVGFRHLGLGLPAEENGERKKENRPTQA